MRRKPRFTSRPWPREVPAGNAWLTIGKDLLTAQPRKTTLPDDLWEGIQMGWRAPQPEQLDYLSEWDCLRARAWLTAWERYA